MLFVFRLVCSQNRESYALTLAARWDHCRLLGVELPQAHPVAASAMSAARRTVDDEVFREAHRRILGRIGDEDLPRWCGRRLLAVDGTRIHRPRELIGDGYRIPHPGCYYPQGLVSCRYRLNDRMPIDFDLAPHGDERRMAADHWPWTRSGDVVVYDRGDYSFELLEAHVRRGIDCVFRRPGNSAQAFQRFAESGAAERLVEVVPGADAARRWQRAHPGETPDPIPVRCARIQTAGEDFLTATTLTDAVRFPRSVLGEADRGRWGIEELYQVSKRLMPVGQFHTRTERGVRQELFAHFTVVALARSLGNRAEGAIGAGLLRDLGECVSKTRPGRSQERISRRPDERFRNANRRSRKPEPARAS